MQLGLTNFTFLMLFIFCSNNVRCGEDKNPFSPLGDTVPDYVNKYYDETGRLIAFPDWQEADFSKNMDKDSIKKLSGDVVIFKYPYTSVPDFNYCPPAEDIVQDISVSLSPDEYEPLTFGIFGLKDTEKVEWSISDFHSKDGKCLDKKFIDVRILRGVPNATVIWNEWVKKERKKTEQIYKRVPLILEKRNPFTLPMHETRHFWLTVYAPDGTVSGVYSGRMALTSRTWKRELPIQINILPVELKTPGMVFNVFLQPDQRAQGFYFKENLSKHLADIKAHGINSIACDLAPEFIYDKNGNAVDINIYGITKDNGTSPYDNLLAFMDMYRREGFNGPLINCFRCFMGYQQYLPARNGKKVNVFDEANIKLMTKFIDQFVKVADEKKVKIALEIGDEPANTVIETQKVNTFIPLIRESFKDITIVTFINGMWRGLNEIEKLSQNPPDVYISNYINEELLDSAKKHSTALWIYSNAREPSRSRYLSGFYSWAIGVKGVATWVYQTDFSYKKSTYINFDGFAGRPFSGSLTTPSVNGPLPMPAWEGYREGVDDQRYIYTLECLIKRIEKESSDKTLLDTAANASRVLGMIRNECTANPISDVSSKWLNPLRFQNYRKAIIAMIIKLQNMRDGKIHEDSLNKKNQEINIVIRNVNGDKSIKMPSANIVFVPEIPGAVTEGDWKRAAVIDKFKIIGNGNISSEITSVKFLVSQGRLFVRFECQDACPEQIVSGKEKKRDQEVWKDDNIELFLLEDGGSDFFKGVHFLLNAGNVAGDSLIDTSKYKFEKSDWDAKWAHTASVEKNGWCSELIIPISELGFGNSNLRKLRFLAGRHLKRKNENSSFPAVDCQFFEPEKMGTLIFLRPESLMLLNDKVCTSVGATRIDVELFNNQDKEFNGSVCSADSNPSAIKIAPRSTKNVFLEICPLTNGMTNIPVAVSDKNGKVILNSNIKCIAAPEIEKVEISPDIIFSGDRMEIDVKNTLSQPHDNITYCIRILKGNDVVLQKKLPFSKESASFKLALPLLSFEKYVMDFSINRTDVIVYRKSVFFLYGIRRTD